MEKCSKCGGTKFIIKGDISGARFIGVIKKDSAGTLSFVPEEIVEYDAGKFKKPVCRECKKEYG